MFQQGKAQISLQTWQSPYDLRVIIISEIQETANEPHRKRCTTYNLTQGGEGSPDVLCRQSEQETLSRQWSFDSGIPDCIDHSAKVDVMLHS